MLKQYGKYTFRKWWPMLLIASILFVTVLSYMPMGIPFETYGTNHVNSTVIFEYLAGASLAIGFPLGIALSLFVHRYRVSRKSVDTYYQASFESRTIRRVHILIALLILVISYTGGFLVASLFSILRYFGTPWTRTVTYSDTTVTYSRVLLPLYGFPIVYIFCLFLIVSQFFINCFLAQLGNYVLDQIFLIIFGNAFLALCFLSPYLYAISVAKVVNTNTEFGLLYSLNSIGPISLLYGVIFASMRGKEVPAGLVVNGIIATLLSCVSYAGACFVCMKMKDPSGEYANNRKTFHPSIRFIPHCAALSIGILISFAGVVGRLSYETGIFGTLIFFSMPIYIFIIYCVVYFMLLALWRHSFKLNKIDWISYIAVCATVALLMIVAFIFIL